MNPQAIQQHMEQHRQIARLSLALDDALGTHHGIAWCDLLLLDLLHTEGGQMTTEHAALGQGLTPTQLLLRVLPMEKLGLVQRVKNPQGTRTIVLGASGRRVLKEALYTADAVLACGV
jgi:MarR family transcriptional regulator, organic hydroperoxide resistance regulator